MSNYNIQTANNVTIAQWLVEQGIKIQLVNPTNGENLTLDPLSNALVVLTDLHHEVHDGHLFTTSYINLSVGNGNNVDIRLVTGTKDTQITSTVKAGGLATVNVYEGANLSGGTALSVRNHFRGMGDGNPPFAAYHTPTVTAVGTLIFQDFVPSGTSPTTRIGAETRQDEEYILSPNTTYLIRINNGSGASIAIGIIISGYTE